MVEECNEVNIAFELAKGVLVSIANETLHGGKAGVQVIHPGTEL